MVILYFYLSTLPFLLQRSYRKELFDNAIDCMVKACIKTSEEINTFRDLQHKVEEFVVQKHKSEVDYGDIPDEFKGEKTFSAQLWFDGKTSDSLCQWFSLTFTGTRGSSGPKLF